MKHKRWFCRIIYLHGCPVCKVRQLTYGFRMDPIGYREELRTIRGTSLFTPAERRWILQQMGQL